MGFSQDRIDIFHYRTNDKKEIDFIVSRGDEMLAIEVKPSYSVGKDDFKHILS
ncbi:MAG TPA: DUF4143 domain-containing protein [Sulfurovum sp.]|nr:DUF4143 domain-containing protein [Sulfurovum sp.]